MRYSNTSSIKVQFLSRERTEKDGERERDRYRTRQRQKEERQRQKETDNTYKDKEICDKNTCSMKV